MLTYQARERVYRVDPGARFQMPSRVVLRFELLPLQAFGQMAGGGKTAVGGSSAVVHFDANTGHLSVEPKFPLKPLEVLIDERDRLVRLYGNILTIETQCKDIKEVDELIQSVYYAFPILLNMEFADPPLINRVTGEVGGTAFSWEVKTPVATLSATSQELQEKRVVDSWLRFNLISSPDRRRLAAALHYLHTACRLLRAGHTPWEFMSESILNFCKILEALFPGTDGGSCDSARDGLRKLGYTNEEIERDFVPAIILRNQIDVGHVFLAMLTRDQLNVIHQYSHSAEAAFQEMLRRMVEYIGQGKADVPPYSVEGVGAEIARTVNAMAARQGPSPFSRGKMNVDVG